MKAPKIKYANNAMALPEEEAAMADAVFYAKALAGLFKSNEK